MSRIVPSLSIILLTTIISLPALGAEAGTTHRIADLVDRALKRSELVASSEKSFESAGWAKGQARAWQNPSVSIGAGRKSAAGENGIAYDAGISQPFYFPGKQKIAGDIAGIQEKIAGLSRDETRLFVRYSVIKLAYQYAVASELAKHLEERVSRFDTIRKYLSSRPFPSPKKRMEKHIVEMRLALLQKDLAGVRSGKDIAWAKLNLFLDFPAPITLTAPWYAKGRVLKWEDLAAHLEKGNIDIKRQALILEKTQSETRLAHSFIWPDFNLAFLYSEERMPKEVERFIGGSATFNVPIWNANKSGVKSYEAATLSEKAKLDFARREWHQALISSHVEYENARRNLERLPVNVIESIHARLEDADESFNKGLIDLVTYGEVEAQVNEMHLAVFGAQYDYVEKYASLLALVGSDEFDFATTPEKNH